MSNFLIDYRPMTLFVIGILVFTIGVLHRCYFRCKYHNVYRRRLHTCRQADELHAIFRPKIYIGISIEVLGCIISVISVCD